MKAKDKVQIPEDYFKYGDLVRFNGLIGKLVPVSKGSDEVLKGASGKTVAVDVDTPLGRLFIEPDQLITTG